MTNASYVFSDHTTGGAEHAELVDYLGSIFDQFSCRRLKQAGVKPGMRCLEVGAGAGSIALWLAEEVGPDGEVIATDNDPDVVNQLPEHAQLQPLLHDIVTDRLDGLFDLIHARAVLVHTPQREAVLAKLAGVLAPSGVLVVEEFADGGWRNCVLDASDIAEAQRLLDTYHSALLATMRAGGSDPTWGHRVNRVMRQVGLAEVGTELGGAVSWPGGSAGCRLPAAMIAQMRPALEAAGAAPADLDALRGLLHDPQLLILNSLLISTIGRNPTSE